MVFRICPFCLQAQLQAEDASPPVKRRRLRRMAFEVSDWYQPFSSFVDFRSFNLMAILGFASPGFSTMCLRGRASRKLRGFTLFARSKCKMLLCFSHHPVEVARIWRPLPMDLQLSTFRTASVVNQRFLKYDMTIPCVGYCARIPFPKISVAMLGNACW